MNQDIYQPPTSNPEQPRPPQGSLWKGLLFGVVIDVIGTLVLGTIYAIVRVVYYSSTGLSEQQIIEKLKTVDHFSAESLFLTFLGLSLSFAGGYTCTKYAGDKAKLGAILLATISVSFGFYFGGSYYSPEENFIFSVLTILAIYFGYNRAMHAAK